MGDSFLADLARAPFDAEERAWIAQYLAGAISYAGLQERDGERMFPREGFERRTTLGTRLENWMQAQLHRAERKVARARRQLRDHRNVCAACPRRTRPAARRPRARSHLGRRRPGMRSVRRAHAPPGSSDEPHQSDVDDEQPGKAA